MIGGASWTWWAGFHAVMIVLLVADSLLTSRRRRKGDKLNQKLALAWTAMLALLAACFAGWIAVKQGHAQALQFVAGYAIETSLSIDNLFIFLVMFEGFRISQRRQREALTWGVAGAIVLRAAFIALGTALLHSFEWFTWIFGVFLLWVAWRLVRGNSAKDAIPEWIRRLQPAKGSLLPVILAVEVTDLLFAVDSIPAVLAITRSPFIVYTSNIAAILGLRSLYFVLSGLLDRLRYLHYGLGALLAFVAFKMLASPWFEIPITVSLAMIGAILAVCAVVSALARGTTNTVP
jgi:tellurite resistance protein TerC